MKDIAKALAITAVVFCLVAVLSVSSCHAGEAVVETAGIDVPALLQKVPAWGWVALAAGLYFASGGSVPALVTLVKGWFSGVGGSVAVPTDIRQILDSVAVLINAMSLKDQFAALWAQVQKAGMPSSFSLSAKWKDGTEQKIEYNSEVKKPTA